MICEEVLIDTFSSDYIYYLFYNFFFFREH